MIQAFGEKELIITDNRDSEANNKNYSSFGGKHGPDPNVKLKCELPECGE